MGAVRTPPGRASASLLGSVERATLRPRRLLEESRGHLEIVDAIAMAQRLLDELRMRLVLDEVRRAFDDDGSPADRRRRVEDALVIVRSAVGGSRLRDCPSRSLPGLVGLTRPGCRASRGRGTSAAAARGCAAPTRTPRRRTSPSRSRAVCRSRPTRVALGQRTGIELIDDVLDPVAVGDSCSKSLSLWAQHQRRPFAADVPASGVISGQPVAQQRAPTRRRSRAWWGRS
jgi:hypothetical protein